MQSPVHLPRPTFVVEVISRLKVNLNRRAALGALSSAPTIRHARTAGFGQPSYSRLRLRSGAFPTSANGSCDQNSAQLIRQNQLERSEEHTSELQSLMRISYAVFCLKKQKSTRRERNTSIQTE